MSTIAFNHRFYIVGVISLVLMGAIVIYSFNTIFGSLSTAFEIETEIPETELRINRDNLDKAFKSVFESQPTQLEVGDITNQIVDTPADEEQGSQDELQEEGI
jgi:hypothetical protein